jgi:transcription termination factor NusB
MNDMLNDTQEAQTQKQVIDKQVIFDRFLTYRKRMSRLAIVQALFLYDIDKKAKIQFSSSDLFDPNTKRKNKDAMLICQEVIYFYKNMFFTPTEYGWNKKSKKVDEGFMFEVVSYALANMDKIDSMISNNLNVRNLIRAATTEILLPHKVEKPVLCSEYTNIANNFFSGKEIGFVNGIIDNIYSKYRNNAKSE